MKKNLTIFALMMGVSVQLSGTLPKPIKYAIKKSRPDLLQDALATKYLTNEQVKECQLLAKKMLAIREENYDQKLIGPKTIIPRAHRYQLISVIGVVLAIQLFNGLYALIEQCWSLKEFFIVLSITLGIQYFMMRAIIKAWTYGSLLKSFCRKPEQKYADALSIDDLFS